jgi:hypothetical protein
MKTALMSLASLVVAGCSVPQLQYNTTDVGRTVGSIYTDQTLENIYDLANDSNAMPSHYSILGGKIATNNSITPSISVPLGSQVTRTVVTNGVSQIVSPYNSFQLQAGQGWNQEWNIVPDRNVDELRLLRSTYRYVLGQIDEQNFRRDLAHMTNFATQTVTSKSEGKKISSSSQTTTTHSLADLSLVENIILECTIDQKSGGCFKILKAPTCSPPAEPLKGQPEEAIDDGQRWTCVGRYGSLYNKVVRGNELVVRSEVFSKGILFDLVLLSLQLQQSVISAGGKS